MPGVHLVWLESPQIASVAQPGQFVMVRCGEDTLLRRPLSVHQVDGGKMALLFAIVGKGTNWLSQRQIGDTVDIFGPMGNGFSIAPGSDNLLLVAGGNGIAPLRFLAQHALQQGYSGKLLMGALTSTLLYPSRLLTEAEVFITTDDGTAGKKGRITDLLPDFIDWADQVFACGPEAMYVEIVKQCTDREVKKPVQFSLEVRMGCGIGACYACSIKTKQGMLRVCKEGPVFNIRDIIWQEVKL